MRLQDLADGRIYATAGRRVLVESDEGGFDTLGRIPNPTNGRARLSYQLRTTSPWKPALERVLGRFCTTNLWVISDTNLLATADRYVFISDDGGENWDCSYQLPDSSGPMGVLPSAVAVSDGEVYLGEYPLSNDDTARILRSSDLGTTWSTFTELPTVRHIHAVQRDPYTGEMWVTTGDRDEECQIGRLHGDRFEPVVQGSQRYRAVELAFTPEYILWGMDCVYAEKKEIFRLERESLTETDPSSTSVATVPGSVFFSETLEVDTEQWVVFSTAMETGGDSTAPAENSNRIVDGVVVGASAGTDFEQWDVIRRFRRPTSVADHLGSVLPSPSGYVFVDSDPERGLLLNPYNATPHDGEILTVSTDWFDSTLRS